jgi:hypothetical protein
VKPDQSLVPSTHFDNHIVPQSTLQDEQAEKFSMSMHSESKSRDAASRKEKYEEQKKTLKRVRKEKGSSVEVVIHSLLVCGSCCCCSRQAKSMLVGVCSDRDCDSKIVVDEVIENVPEKLETANNHHHHHHHSLKRQRKEKDMCCVKRDVAVVAARDVNEKLEREEDNDHAGLVDCQIRFPCLP